MMHSKEIKTHAAVNEDIPALKSLWKTVFGDPDEAIAHFIDFYFTPDLTVVAKDGRMIVSVAYILPVGELVLPDGKRTNCAMLYAIATLPGYRGRGFGTAVTNAAALLAGKKGFYSVVLKPEDNGLFAYYEKHTGFKPFFEAAEIEYSYDILPSNTRNCTLIAAQPSSYRRLRQSILGGSAYIDTDEKALSYQQRLCQASGGDIYIITSGGSEIGCAVVEPGNETVFIKELLLPCDLSVKEAAGLVARHHFAKQYIVRHPTNLGLLDVKKSSPFGMLLLNKCRLEHISMQSAKWYGPAFD